MRQETRIKDIIRYAAKSKPFPLSIYCIENDNCYILGLDEITNIGHNTDEYIKKLCDCFMEHYKQFPTRGRILIVISNTSFEVMEFIWESMSHDNGFTVRWYPPS